ncbi:MAG: hypothetical protein P8P99_01095 [Maricaulis sp.]|nr:hypothetical protein [Maricaulis sp.]
MSHKTNKNDDHIHPLASLFMWTEAKWLKGAMVYILGFAFLAMASVDLFHHRHEYLDYAASTGFYAYAGFGAFVLAVMVGWFVIRGLLGREEDYWDKDAGDD